MPESAEILVDSNLRIDDGTDLMVAVVWHPDERRQLFAHGTYREPDGAATYLEDGDFSFTAQSVWVSPDTGVNTPWAGRWRRTVGMSLELTSCLEQWGCRLPPPSCRA